MSADVFVLSSVRGPGPSAAMQQAMEVAGLSPARVQDAVFGFDSPAPWPDCASITSAAGLTCSCAGVSSSLRAIFFSAAAILSDDVDLSLVIGIHHDVTTALLLASPDAVGGLNLLPRARLAARSLAGPEPTLRRAELTAADIEISRAGLQAASLLHDLLDELESVPARWGMLQVHEAALLVERI